MKKVTMKDIALQANVSVATVSYVLNNVNNQTIPQKTRLQILQIAEELHYIPNLAARSLVNQKTGLIGILVNETPDMPFWKRYGHSSFIQALERRLTRAGYHALLYSLDADRPSLDIILERKLEAAFLVDVREEYFYTISGHFVEGVPLILIDSLIDDKLFKQVVYDFGAAFQQLLPVADSETCLITESFNNAGLNRYIQGSVSLSDENVFQVRTLEELDSVLSLAKYRQAIVVNEFIAAYAEKSGAFGEMAAVCTCGCRELLGAGIRTFEFREDKAQAAFDLMSSLLDDPSSGTKKKNRIFIG